MVVKKLSKKEAADNAATKAVFDRVTDNYSPGPDPIGMRFGLQAPKTCTKAWGFRAIKEGSGFSLLWDRQGNYPLPTPESAKEDKTFCKFLDNDVIPHLRRYSGWLYADDSRYYHFKFSYQETPAGPPKQVRAVISPRASHGYIYGVVYVDATLSDAISDLVDMGVNRK